MSNNDSTPTDSDTVRVDLSDDLEGEDTTPTADRQPGQQPEAVQSRTQPTEEQQKRAREMAQRHVQEARGGTDAERIDHAFETLQTKHQRAREQHQEIARQKEEIEMRHEQFEATKAHLQELQDEEDDRLILRDWAAGITTEVKESELPEAISLIEERQEQQQESLAELTDRADQLEEQALLTDLACHQLEGARNTLSGLVAETDSRSAARHDGRSSSPSGGGRSGSHGGGGRRGGDDDSLL